MKHPIKYLLSGSAALILLASIPSAQASLIAYEGFDTSASNGTDFTNVGTTGSGFNAPDSSTTNWRMDIEDGLSYTDNFGNSLLTRGKSAGMEAVVNGTQNLQLGLSSTITNSGTVYSSFLINVTAIDTWGINVGLQDSQVGDQVSPTTSLEAAFRSTSTNYGIFSDGAEIRDDSGPATGTGLFFVVSELNMDSETMTTYLNPGDLNDVVGSASHTLSDTASGTWEDMNSFIFSLGGTASGTVDEIRIGTTLGDVTPVPEPSTYALFFGIATLGFTFFYRRRKSA